MTRRLNKWSAEHLVGVEKLSGGNASNVTLGNQASLVVMPGDENVWRLLVLYISIIPGLYLKFAARYFCRREREGAFTQQDSLIVNGDEEPAAVGLAGLAVGAARRFPWLGRLRLPRRLLRRSAKAHRRDPGDKRRTCAWEKGAVHFSTLSSFH